MKGASEQLTTTDWESMIGITDTNAQNASGELLGTECLAAESSPEHVIGSPPVGRSSWFVLTDRDGFLV